MDLGPVGRSRRDEDEWKLGIDFDHDYAKVTAGQLLVSGVADAR